MATLTDDLTRLVDAHRDVYNSLLTLCEGLVGAQWMLPTGCPGWTVKDNFSHVVGLEAVLAGDPEPDHEVPDLPHVRDEVGRYMERHVDARRYNPIADLLIEARDVFSRRLGILDTITSLEEEVPGPAGWNGPAYRVLRTRVFDMWAHEQDIRRAIGAPGHLEGPAPRFARDRIVRGLAHVLPDRLDRPDATLVLEITGTQELTVAIDLATGELTDGPVDDAAVTLTMPFPDLVARGCGRADAPPSDIVLVRGDRDLANRILDDLSVTP